MEASVVDPDGLTLAMLIENVMNFPGRSTRAKLVLSYVSPAFGERVVARLVVDE